MAVENSIVALRGRLGQRQRLAGRRANATNMLKCTSDISPTSTTLSVIHGSLQLFLLALIGMVERRAGLFVVAAVPNCHCGPGRLSVMIST